MEEFPSRIPSVCPVIIYFTRESQMTYFIPTGSPSIIGAVDHVD